MSIREYRMDYRRRVLGPFVAERRVELDGVCESLEGLGGDAPVGVDLVVLYDVVASMSRAELSERVALVHDVWARLQGSYGPLVGPLQRLQRYLQHGADPDVHSEDFWQQRFAERREQMQARVDEFQRSGVLAGEYGAFGVVTVGLLRDAAAQFGIRPQDVDDSELRAVAGAAGLEVTDAVAVPEVALTPGLDEVFKSSHRSLLHAIFAGAPAVRFDIVDGFTAPNGRRLTLEAVQHRRDDLKTKPQNDDTVFTDRALAAIQHMNPHNDRELHAIVFGHFIHQLQQQPPTLPTLRIKHLEQLGLTPTDAARVTLHLTNRHTPTPQPAVAQARGGPTTLASLSGTPTSAPDDAPTPTLAREHAALIALYRSTDGPNWKIDTAWATDLPIDQWHGITINHNGHVTRIELRHNDLTGSIPSQLGDLTNLNDLDLNANSLTGPIPPQLGSLTELNHLQLRNNFLNGSIPPQLGNLTNLYTLDLNANSLTGPIPPQLGNLTGLRALRLHSNSLTGSIPPELGNLTNLNDLDLNANSLTGPIPPQLSRFSPEFYLTSPHSAVSTSADARYEERADMVLSMVLSPVVRQLIAESGIDVATISGTGMGGRITRADVEQAIRATYAKRDRNERRARAEATASDAQRAFSRIAISAPDDAPTPTLAAERAALVVLYRSTGGPNWKANHGWDTDTPIDQWHGITTSNDGHTTEIKLWDNGLTGTIPPQFGDLTNLEELKLDSNSLTGSIPSQLGNLTNLEALWLDSNSLTGSIPSQLGNLTNLEELKLDSNSLTGSIPSQLGNLQNLCVLSLSHNSLTGSIPSQLGNLTNLEALCLDSNSLTGSIPSQLGNLQNLSVLSLENNNLTGPIPSQLGNLTNLEQLNLHDNCLTEHIPSQLGNFTNLYNLRLANNSLTGPIPPQLGNLKNLYHLELADNSLTGSLPSPLGRFSLGYQKGGEPRAVTLAAERAALVAFYRSTGGPNWKANFGWDTDTAIDQWYGITTRSDGHVTEVHMDGNGLTGSIPLQLGNLQDLQELNLRHNSLTGSIPPQLGNLTNLLMLNLQNNGLTGSIPSQLGNLTNLEALFLENNSLTGSIPSQLGNLTNLEALFLENNSLTGSIPPQLGNLTNLETLFMENNSLSGPIPSQLGNLTNLQDLHLWDNRLTGSLPSELGNFSLGQQRSRPASGYQSPGPVYKPEGRRRPSCGAGRGTRRARRSLPSNPRPELEIQPRLDHRHSHRPMAWHHHPLRRLHQQNRVDLE